MIIKVKKRNLNINNMTPLHIAVQKDLITLIELLISKGADMNAKDIIYQITKNHF